MFPVGVLPFKPDSGNVEKGSAKVDRSRELMVDQPAQLKLAEFDFSRTSTPVMALKGLWSALKGLVSAAGWNHGV